MKIFTRILSLFILSFFTSVVFSKPHTDQLLDNIVAVVNDDAITEAELAKAIITLKSQITQNHISMPNEKIIRQKALNKLIDKRIQLQLAKQANLQVSEAELDNVIINIAKQNNLSVNSLYQQLNHHGITTTHYREELRDQLLLEKLQQQEVTTRITISEQEIAHFMKSQPWQQAGTKEYHLQNILVPLSDAPSSTEIAKAKQKAQQILSQLRRGHAFESMALNESGDTQAVKGGDLGFRKLPEIPSAFAEYVTNMQPKELAGPIQTPNGFHLIRLLEIRILGAKHPAAGLSRKQIERLLLQRKYEEAVQNWVSKQRSQSYIVNYLKP